MGKMHMTDEEFRKANPNHPDVLKVQPKLRTIVEFFQNGRTVRTVSMEHEIPNAAVGQRLNFDHPLMSECLTGTIMKINQVIFLVDPPLTYIDVEIAGDWR